MNGCLYVGVESKKPSLAERALVRVHMYTDLDMVQWLRCKILTSRYMYPYLHVAVHNEDLRPIAG